jgi:hypothetical protein
VLYGGAAGSGKSDALIIDALGGECGAVQLSEYRVLLLRRAFSELREIVDRTQAIYPKAVPGAVYASRNGVSRVVCASSSATSLLMLMSCAISRGSSNGSAG